jgi:hypothetical protein
LFLPFNFSYQECEWYCLLCMLHALPNSSLSYNVRISERQHSNESSSSIILSRDRSVASSKLSFSVFGERLSRKSCNAIVSPFAFHIAVQQPLKPLWSLLLLCDHEPSQPSTVLCFMSLLMSLLPASGELVSEFPSPRVILSFFPHP